MWNSLLHSSSSHKHNVSTFFTIHSTRLRYIKYMSNIRFRYTHLCISLFTFTCRRSDLWDIFDSPPVAGSICDGLYFIECNFSLNNLFFLFILRGVLSAPKSIQATVTLLENLHLVLEKSVTEEMRLEILPILYTSFDSNTIQVQVCKVFSVLAFRGLFWIDVIGN